MSPPRGAKPKQQRGKPSKSKRRAGARRPQTRFVFRDDNRYRISFYTFFTIFLIFLGGAGTALTYAYIADAQAQISRARTELQTQKETNAALRSEITQKYTLDEVARAAVERLGMIKPDSSQVIHIYVPKQSYVVLNDEYDIPDTTNYFWQGIVSFFRQLFGRAE